MTDTNPFIELPLHYGEGAAIYIRRSQVVVLEPATRHSDMLDGQKLHGTDVWFSIGDRFTNRFIPLSPHEVMQRLDRRPNKHMARIDIREESS